MSDIVQKNQEQGPPDLEEVFKKFTRKKKPKGGDGGGSGSGNTPGGPVQDVGDTKNLGVFIGILIVVAIVIWAISGIFIVKPAEKAAVLRFGKYTKTVGPGPHWFPRFVDQVVKLNVDQVSALKLDALMLTQNENIVSVQFTVQYKIGDLQDYLFNVVNPVDTLSQSLDSAVRQVVGHSTLDNILTIGRAAIADKVRVQLEKLVKQYKTGINVVDVTMQPATAPGPVKDAFDDVIKAREDKVRYANQATSYANNVVPVAKGKASRLTQQAQAQAAQVVNMAKGETAEFNALLPQYKAAPKVTDERLYFQTMENVLAHNQVIVTGKGGHNIIYVPLDKTMHLPAMKASSANATTESAKAASSQQAGASSNSNNPQSMLRQVAYLRWKEAQK